MRNTADCIGPSGASVRLIRRQGILDAWSAASETVDISPLDGNKWRDERVEMAVGTEVVTTLTREVTGSLAGNRECDNQLG
jgi:hypothetical protein